MKTRIELVGEDQYCNASAIVEYANSRGVAIGLYSLDLRPRRAFLYMTNGKKASYINDWHTDSMKFAIDTMLELALNTGMEKIE